MKYTKHFLAIALTISFFLAVLANFVKQSPPSDLFSSCRDRYIAHAGGIIDGHTYTNSLEALRNAIFLEFHNIELDFLTTADGQIVAGHDWETVKNKIGYPINGRGLLTYSEYINRKIDGLFTPVSLDTASKFFKINSGINLFTDKLTDYHALVNFFDTERLFVETFSIFGYLHALYSGVRRPMLEVSPTRLGVLWAKMKVLIFNPDFVTINYHTYYKYNDYYKWLLTKVAYVFVYTVNDQNLAGAMIRDGVAAVYTDTLSPRDICK